MEASLAFRGIDLLDLWRGTLSLRALFIRIAYLPGDDPLWAAIQAAEERAKTTRLHQRLRDRTRHYQAHESQGGN